MKQNLLAQIIHMNLFKFKSIYIYIYRLFFKISTFKTVKQKLKK